MGEIVVRKPFERSRGNPDAVARRVQPDRTVRGRHESMPERGLNHSGREHLPHPLQGLHCFGDRFSRKPVHQIGMHHDPGLLERVGDSSGVIHRDALLHPLQHVIGGDFQSAADRDAPRGGEKTAQVRREGLLEANIPPP